MSQATTLSEESNLSTIVEQNNDSPLLNQNQSLNTNETIISNPTISQSLANISIQGLEQGHIFLSSIQSEQLITIHLLLLKKIVLTRKETSLTKYLLCDGVEFLEISEWRSSSGLLTFQENQTILFSNFFLKRSTNTNSYSIKMNLHQYTLIKTDTSNLQQSSLVINRPASLRIHQIFELASNYYK